MKKSVLTLLLLQFFSNITVGCRLSLCVCIITDLSVAGGVGVQASGRLEEAGKELGVLDEMLQGDGHGCQ